MNLHMLTRISLMRAAAVLLTALAARPSSAQDFLMVRDLRGEWKFEIGDDPRRAESGFDDEGWVSIFAPSKWEDEGFPGYDGYAWYRKEFTADKSWEGKPLYLRLGYIDDVDEVYINGQFVGFSGVFPPHYSTAYGQERSYLIQPTALRYGRDNVIAVRVYDSELGGGIVHGRIGIYEDRGTLRADVPLPGPWKFMKGDDEKWKEPSLDDSRWKRVEVPAWWETQGFKDYDGFGWYRTTFRVPGALHDKQLIVVLGRIDDFDEVYLNGKRIGRTGHFNKKGSDVVTLDDYRKLRAYTIPSGFLNDGDNVLAVRVYDGYIHGGIYDGPVGIVTRDRWREWSGKDNVKKKRLMERIFDWFW
jgi:sialate O-acetylesterase